MIFKYKETFILSEDGPLKRALKKIRDGNHDDEECRENCNANKELFKSTLYECPFLDNGNETTKLLEPKKVSIPTVQTHWIHFVRAITRLWVGLLG